MKSFAARFRVSMTALLLVASAALPTAPAHAQQQFTQQQLQFIATVFLNGTAARVRTIFNRSFILLLQRSPALASVAAHPGGAVCLNQVLPAARNNLGCNPADPNCANAVNAQLLRELLALQLDLTFAQGVVLDFLTPGTVRTNLLNSVNFQEFIARRILANVLANDGPQPFTKFSDVVASRAAPTPSSPLPVRIEAGACDINDAAQIFLRPNAPANDSFRQVSVELFNSIFQSPSRDAICAPLPNDDDPCGTLALQTNPIFPGS